ncbi:MAG: hypothetical protein Q7T91_00770 [Sulfuricurvum sp.]|nr:hypothetical protein [Sulfuricurvum sp.]
MLNTWGKQKGLALSRVIFLCVSFAELMVLIDYWHSAAFHGWDDFDP